MILKLIKRLFQKEQPKKSHSYKYYIKNKLPFVIRGGAKKLLAFEKWTDKYLVEKIGDYELDVEVSANKIFNPDSPNAKCELIGMKLKDYIKRYNKNFISSKQYFLPQVSIPTETNILSDDVVRTDLLKLMNSTRRTKYKKRKPLDVLFFLGNNNNVTPMHTDSYHNFYHMLDGEKDILLIPPRYTKQIKQYTKFNHLNIPDIENIDYNKYPAMKDIPITKVHLNKGDLLYIPYECWHQMKGCKGRNLAVALWF